MRQKLWIVIAVLISVSWLSCGGKTGPAEGSAESPTPVEPQEVTYSEVVKDGITHVHNTGPRWGKASQIRLELIRVLGGGANSDPELAFYKPSDIALDTQGNLYVLDAGNFRIKKIGPDGMFMAAFGHEGQGPGEFQFMDGIVLDEQGRMYVSDKATNAVKILAPDGKEIDALPSGGPAGKLARLSSGDLVSLRTLRSSPALLQRFDPKGKGTAEFGTREAHEDADRSRYFNRVFFASDADDSVYIAYGTRNRIEKYSPAGELLLSTDRPLNFPESEEITYQEHQLGPRKIPIPFLNFVSADIAVDTRARLWVLSYERQLKFEEMGLTMHFRDGDGRYEGDETLKDSDEIKIDAFAFHIFDSQGHFLGKIPLTHHAGVVRIFQDRLYLLEPKHAMCVYIYRIIE